MEPKFWKETTISSVEVNGRGQALDSDQRILEDFGSSREADRALRSLGWNRQPHERGDSIRTTTYIHSRADENTNRYLTDLAAKQKAEREALDWNQFGRVAVQPGGFVRELDTNLQRGIATFENQKAGVEFLEKRGWQGPYKQRCPNDDLHMVNPARR